MTQSGQVAHAPEAAIKAISEVADKAGDIANGARAQLGFGSANRELTRVDESLALSDNPPAAMVRDAITKLCETISTRQSQWREAGDVFALQPSRSGASLSSPQTVSVRGRGDGRCL